MSAKQRGLRCWYCSWCCEQIDLWWYRWRCCSKLICGPAVVERVEHIHDSQCVTAKQPTKSLPNSPHTKQAKQPTYEAS